ncbi:cytochrome P450 [Xylariaceae sp. FL1019]|nr:cytochrome P450 [Xylariaceae sp. FL1019]
MQGYLVFGMIAIGVIAMIIRKLYPTPFPGIPYNPESAKRIMGDIPNMIPIIQATNERSGPVFAASAQKLGTPIAQLLLPGKPLIVLEDPRQVEDIILNRNKEFDKAPRAVDVMAPMFPNGTIGQRTTPKLKMQKRLWADITSTEFLLKAAGPSIYASFCELVDLWRLKTSESDSNLMEIHEDFQNAALDAIWSSVVGEKPGITRHAIENQNKQPSESEHHPVQPPFGLFLKDELNYISEAISRNAATPFPKWASKLETYTPRYRRSRKKITTEIEAAMRRSVQRARDNEHDTCLMDLVLRRRAQQMSKESAKPLPDPWTDQNILDETFVILVGGHDSTANALTWFVRYMDMFPSAQTELRRALKVAFPGNSMPSLEEILNTNIPYLDAALEEGLRLAGIAKGNVRQALVDTEILGYKIPKGAEIFMSYHIDRAPAPIDSSKRSTSSQTTIAKRGDVFQGNAARDLEVFEPKRWLVKDGESNRDIFDPQALPSLAFSGGYRGCAGRKMAYMELRIAVTLLILNFEFLELPEDYRTLSAVERLFREPSKPYARIKAVPV